MKEQTKKEMQQKMADYQMSAPEVSWEEIKQAVGVRSQNADAQKRPVAIVPMQYKRIAAVAAFVIFIAGSIVFWMLHRQGQNENLQGQSQNRQQEQLVAASDISKVHDSSLKVEVSSKPISQTIATAMVAPHIQNTITTNPSLEESGVQAENNKSAENGMPTEENTQKEDDTQVLEQSAPLQHSPASTTHLPTAKRLTADTRLTAKVYFANSMNSYTNSATFTPMLMNANPFGIYDDAMANEGNTPLNNNSSELKTSIHHHQPLRFGLSLRYNLGSRWSVESGLSYSHHKSDITNQSGDHETTIEQQLSYIGIPLIVGYRIWSSNRLGLYASAGGMAEKMVKGSRTVQGTTEHVSIHPLQFSLNCSVGAELRIDKSFSFYAEPGLSYHFDNGSNVPTIYQDNPLNLNLSFGLRFSFK